MPGPSTISTSLGGQFRRHVAAYLLGGLMLGIFQLSMNRIDWLSKAAIDRVFGADPGTAWRPAAWMLVLAVVAFGTRVASRWAIFNAGRDVEYDLRAVLLERLHRLGTAFYRKMSAGEIMSRSTNDLLQVRLLFGFGVLNMVNVVFGMTSALQVMLLISLRLTVVSFLTLPVLVVVTRRFSKQLYVRTRENQSALGKLSEVLQSNLAGVRVVRSFALEEKEASRFDEANRGYLESSLSLARLRGSMGPAIGASTAGSTLLFFWYGGVLLLRGPEAGGITPGSFFAFGLALTRMAWPLVGLGFALAVVQRGRAGFSRLKEVFDAEPEVLDGSEPPLAKVDGAIRVEHLTFRYGERAVLDDVAFDVPAGTSLAIVGRTGSGKTTLAMLLSRLLPTPRGSVFLDGHDVCDLPLASVRRAVGYAQQDAFLFSTTVGRNIGFSFDAPDEDDAVAAEQQAAKDAQIYDEVMSLPEQFDTVVGERGVQLSGGQKQRIALSRALVWGPSVLVLDDPLSAVDARTEAAILRSIEKQAARCTLLLVTHRVAAAARCDQIVVLDQGRVVERGTHDELVKAEGLYAAFAEEQQMARELDEIDVDAPSSGTVSMGGAP